MAHWLDDFAMPRRFGGPYVDANPTIYDAVMSYRCEIRLRGGEAAAMKNVAANDSAAVAKQWEGILGRHAAWTTMVRGWWLEDGLNSASGDYLLLLEFKVRTISEEFKEFARAAENWQTALFSDLWASCRKKEGVERAAFFEWDALDQFPGRRASFSVTEAEPQAPLVPVPQHLHIGNTAQ